MKENSLSFIVVVLHVFELTSSFSVFNFFKGVYGTQGTGTTSTTPGGRYDTSTWTAADGTLWLFGGVGRDSAGFDGECFLILLFFLELGRKQTTQTELNQLRKNNNRMTNDPLLTRLLPTLSNYPSEDS
jgi:hypothetical protein